MSMKKILAVLLTLMMIFAATGAMASANLQIRNKEMRVGWYAVPVSGNNVALQEQKPESGGYAYWRSDNVLELHDFRFPSYTSFQMSIGVNSGDGLFTIEVYGDNLINNAYTGSAATSSNAIYCALPLEIKLIDGATLRTEGTSVSKSNYGIWANETLSITGNGTLDAIGESTKATYRNSAGIWVQNNSNSATAMTVGSGVTINAVSGNAYLASYGIYVNGKLSTAGNITAQSGTGNNGDYAICAPAVEITGGSLTAKAADTSSVAMNVAPSVYSGAQVLVSKTSNAVYDPALSYSAADITDYTYVQVGGIHSHYACGDSSCKDNRHEPADHTAVTYTPYQSGMALSGGKGYVLTADTTVSSTVEISGSSPVYLCLNGYDLIADGKFSTLTVSGKLVLCDCSGMGSITHAQSVNGRGVDLTGTMRMYGGKIAGNNLANQVGAGVHMSSQADFALYGGEISNNHTVRDEGSMLAADGGGVYMYSGSTLSINGGRIAGNTVHSGNGGGVYVDGGSIVNLMTGSIENCEASEGGGIYVYYGSAGISGGSISGCSASSGGGIYVDGGDSLAMAGGEITGNEATTGAGVYVEGSMTSGGGEITGNIVSNGNGGGVFVHSNSGKLTVGGAACITGNTKGSGASAQANNIYLPAYKTMDSMGLGSEAQIGVTTQNLPTVNASVNYMSAASGYTLDGADLAATWHDTDKNKTEIGNRIQAEIGQFYVEPETYAVSVSAGTGGTANGNGRYAQGESVHVSAEADEGYEFTGWSGDVTFDNAKSAETSFTMPDNAVTVTANFKTIEYTLSYDLDGGSLPEGESNPDAYTVESGAITLANPQKEGYTFAGWTGTDLTEATETVTIPTGSTGSRSYTATWTKNAAPTHTHYICGEDACTEHSGTEHQSVTYAPYTAGMTLEGGMAVYLTENVTVSEMIEITSMDAVYLCLNGFTLTADGDFDVIGGYAGSIVLCDCKSTGKITHAAGKKGSGIRFSHNGRVTMFGGEISGNTPQRGGGGGVDTGSQGYMSMYGGKICGNTGGKGGGVYSSNGFYMYGGEISGNTSTGAGGGVAASFFVYLYGGTVTGNTAGGNGAGVYIDSDGYPCVKGGMTITGNHKGSGDDAQANNLFLADGVMMTADGALTGQIGVTTQNDPTITTPVAYLKAFSDYELTASDLAATFSDKGFDKRIGRDGKGELYVKADSYIITAQAWPSIGGAVQLTPAAEGGVYAAGTELTMTAAAAQDYAFEGWYRGESTTAESTDASYTITVGENASFTAKFRQTVHRHYACGDVYSACTDPAHADHQVVTYVPYTENMTLTDGMNVYLTDYSRAAGTITIPAGMTVRLCLNGQTLQGNADAINVEGTLILCDCQSGGSITHVQIDTGWESYPIGAGAGLKVSGTVRMYGGSILSNQQGVNIVSGSMTMYGGSISKNRPYSGAGQGGLVISGGSFTMLGGSVDENSGSGLIINGGTVEIGGDAKITDNYTTGNGGGIQLNGGTLTVSGGKIESNSSGNSGGGIYAGAGTLVMTGGEIRNHWSYPGSGVYLDGTASMRVSGGVRISDMSSVYLPSGKTFEAAGALTGGQGAIRVETKDDPNTAPVDYMTPASGYTLTETDLAATSSNNSRRIGTDGIAEIYVPAGLTLYAEKGGSVTGGGNYAKGDSVTALAEAEAGYAFDGWYDRNNQKVSDQASYTFTITEHTSLTAKFVKDAYTITYDLAGGSLPEGKSNPATYGETTAEIMLVNPEKAGYTFAGWTGTGLDGASQTVVIPKGSSGNRSYTATWTAEHAHRACGDTACSHSGHTADVVYLPWDGSTALALEGGKIYAYYLTKYVKLDQPVVVPKDTMLYLCLNGCTLDGTTKEDLFTVENGGSLVICANGFTEMIAPAGRMLNIKAGASAQIYRGTIWGGAAASMIQNAGTLFMQGTSLYAKASGVIGVDNLSGAQAEMSNWKMSSNAAIGGRSQKDTTGIYNRVGAAFTISNMLLDDHDAAIINEGTFTLKEGGRNTMIKNNNTGIRTTGTLTHANASITDNALCGVEYLSGSMTIDGNGVYLDIRNNGPENARKNLYIADGLKIILGGYYGAARIGVTHEKQAELATPIDFAQAKADQVIAGTYFSTVFTSDVPDYTAKLTTDGKTGQLVMASGKVTIVNGTGSAEGLGSLESVVKGTTVSVKANEAPAGYVFTGWTSEDGVTFADAAAAETTFVMPGKDVTVTANFAKDDYTITYDLAGGELPDGKENPVSYSVDTPSFMLEEPQKHGYEFAGWTGSNGTTPQKGIGVAQGSTGNLSFTANYTPVEYPILIDLDGGALEDGKSNPEHYTIETESFTLVNPVKENHAFLGWTGSCGEEPVLEVTIEKGTTGELSYKANFSLNSYRIDVAFDETMGSVSGAGVYEHGAQVTLTAQPNAGYAFAGWMNEQGVIESTDAVFIFTATAPRSLTAVFELIPAPDLPQTGDASMLTLWCALLGMSACALVLRRRKA